MASPTQGPTLVRPFGDQRPCRFPLLFDLCPALEGGLIRGDIADRDWGIVRDLADDRCLFRLPRSGENLDKPAWFFQPLDQRTVHGAMLHSAEPLQRRE